MTVEHPPFPGESPQDWSRRVLESYARRDIARACVKRSRRRYLVRGCVYCGGRVKTSRFPSTCGSHQDLPALDPNYGGGE